MKANAKNSEIVWNTDENHGQMPKYVEQVTRTNENMLK